MPERTAAGRIPATIEEAEASGWLWLEWPDLCPIDFGSYGCVLAWVAQLNSVLSSGRRNILKGSAACREAPRPRGRLSS
jgi:hypothetical protein